MSIVQRSGRILLYQVPKDVSLHFFDPSDFVSHNRRLHTHLVLTQLLIQFRLHTNYHMRFQIHSESVIRSGRALLLVVILYLTHSPAACADEAKVLPAELVTVVRNAKIIKEEYPLRASLNNHEAILTTQRAKGTSDNDCKIDALFMAKALMQAFPQEVLRVKVLFSDYDNQSYSQIQVSKGDVTAFGSGQISQQDLLNSVELTKFKEDVSLFAPRGDQSDNVSITPGFMQDKRLLLLSRIESLKQRGTNVKVYEDYFQKIENLVRDGNEDDAKTAIDTLSRGLTDQEKALEDASVISMQRDLLRFQATLKRYAASGKKLPFPQSEIYRVNQLVVSGRKKEAAALLQSLTAKLR